MTTPSDEATQSSSGAAAAEAPSAAANDEDPPRAPALALGEVLAGRYRIVRFVAHGGMGEVYEADDLELSERVALKRLLPEIGGSRRAIERFKREIQLARRVTHPNICRIFDLGFAEAGAGGGQPTAFLTMELLEGETLAARIRREGRLKPAAALPIVEQMAAALGALHAAGIIHRDFKSQNVLLVGAQGERAVVTDFGLARISSGEQLGDMNSFTGALLGSPSTMAPEQVEGKKVTAGADVYALGVVLFEMVTGRLPFAGANPLATAFKRLQEAPPSARSLVPDLDGRWSQTIARCLRRAPEERFASAADVAAALAGRQTSSPRRPSRLGLVGLGLGGALVLAGGAAALHQHRPPVHADQRRRSVAVLGFKNLSGRGENAWLSTAMSEMLRTELAAADRVRLVPGESVARMKTDLALADADSFASDTLGRIKQNIDADYLVVGSYTALGKEAGGKIRFDVRLQDTHAGELLASVSESGTETDLLELVSRTGKRLRDSLHAEAAPGALDRAQASLPENPEAARLYAEGLASLRTFDAMGARAALERAIAVEPSHPMIHSALSQALQEMGYQERAVAEGKRAVELAGDLSREERLLVEGRYHEADREWDEAIATYRTLFDAFPDNLDYGLRLARAQSCRGRYTDATAVVEALRRRQGAAFDDPRIDLAEAWATPDFRVQERAASRAAQKGRARGARLLVAEAENSMAMAYIELGRPDDAIAATERARRLWAEMGNDAGAAGALDMLSQALAAKGQLGSAIARDEETGTLALKAGNKDMAARSLHLMAMHYLQRGDLASARVRWDESMRLFSQVHDRTIEELRPRMEGWMLFTSGDLDGAERFEGQVRALSAASENIRDDGFVTGMLLLQRDHLDEAREQFTRALELYEGKGIAAASPSARLGIGLTYLEQDRPAEAESTFREMLASARTILSPHLDAIAWSLIARAAAAQDHTEEASEALDHALELVPRLETMDARAAVAQAALLVRGDASDRKRALATLADSVRAGTVINSLYLRLALGTQALESGRDHKARAELLSLEQEAKGRGFALIARKAAALVEGREAGEEKN